MCFLIDIPMISYCLYQSKNFENWLKFGKVRGNNFLDHSVQDRFKDSDWSGKS